MRGQWQDVVRTGLAVRQWQTSVQSLPSLLGAPYSAVHQTVLNDAYQART